MINQILYDLLRNYKAQSIFQFFSYLNFKFKKLWNVVEDSAHQRYVKQVLFATDMSQWVNNGEVSFDGHRDCEEYRTHTTNVTETISKRHDVNVYLLLI